MRLVSPGRQGDDPIDTLIIESLERDYRALMGSIGSRRQRSDRLAAAVMEGFSDCLIQQANRKAQQDNGC
jgi:hypothetical protein